MRAILLVLIVAVVAVIGLIATGLVDVSQIRGAKPPAIQARDGAIRAEPGQTPKFKVETGSVGLGKRETNVAAEVGPVRGQTKVSVPTVVIKRPSDEAPGNSAE
jgi:hypothetical protein